MVSWLGPWRDRRRLIRNTSVCLCIFYPLYPVCSKSLSYFAASLLLTSFETSFDDKNDKNESRLKVFLRVCFSSCPIGVGRRNSVQYFQRISTGVEIFRRIICWIFIMTPRRIWLTTKLCHNINFRIVIKKRKISHDAINNLFVCTNRTRSRSIN